MGIAFYVSGHGYGHAVRSAEVMKAVLARRPRTRLYARTNAPAFLFPPGVAHAAAGVDSGIVESPDTLRILSQETAGCVARFMRRADEVAAREAAWVRDERVRLLVADIPFLAGEIARRAGVPSIGIANFTWDWIYEPHLAADPRWPEWERRIRAGYAHFTRLLKLPFAQDARLDVFREVTDIPLIARRGCAAAEAGPPRVLIAMRGVLDPAAVRRAAREAPEFLFVHSIAGLDVGEPNVRFEERSFPDLVAASRVVVSKLGYGTAAECVANRTNLLYPPREGFREDPIVVAEAGRYIHLRELAPEDFRAGRWAPHLRRILALRPPAGAAQTGGAERCADEVVRALAAAAAPASDEREGQAG